MIGDMLQGLIEEVRAEERKNYVLRILAVIGAIAARDRAQDDAGRPNDGKKRRHCGRRKGTACSQ